MKKDIYMDLLSSSRQRNLQSGPKESESDEEEEREEEKKEKEEDGIESVLAAVNKNICDIMQHEHLKFVTPLQDVCVRLLLAFRDGKRRPSSKLDRSFFLLQKEMLYSRREKTENYCQDCGARIWIVERYENGWQCREPSGPEESRVVHFCDDCLAVVDEEAD